MNKKKSAVGYLREWSGRYHASFAWSVVLAVVGVACGILPYFCLTEIINLLLQGQGMQECIPWCVAIIASYVGKTVFSSLSTTLSHRGAYFTLRDLRKNLLGKLSRVPMGTILDTPSGEYKAVIVDRVESMEHTLAHLLPEMTSNLLIPLVIILYIFVIDWRMGIAALVSTGIGLYVVSKNGKVYAKWYPGSVENGHRMTNAIVEYVGGIQVVKAFSQSAGSYRKYETAVRRNADYYVDWMRNSQKYMCIWQSLVPAVLVGVLPAGLWFWSMERLSASDFLSVVVLALGFASPLLAAMSFVDDLSVLRENVGEIAEILETEELIRPENYAGSERSVVTIHGEATMYNAHGNFAGIALEDVSFSYGEEEVLHHVNLTIKPATMTALVGPSGSGKSTIAKLIAGFWDTTGGSVLLNGVDIRQIPLEQYNHMIAYVSQDNYLFDRSVRENIRMGNLKATDIQVEAVAKAAGCDRFIRDLEQGYDTVCGSGGGRLSGGEKQRISIARAMLKDAPVVILDEATASIDPENEAMIQQAISSLTKGKTLIVIAHRLSTIVNAEKIVVVNHGNIEAQGTQEELLADCPLYAKMWQAHMGTQDR